MWLLSRTGFKPEHSVPKATKEWLRTHPQTLAFIEVWDDLIGVVESKRLFNTLDGKESFTADVFHDAEGGGIHISDIGSPVFFHKEQLLDLWQQVREMGICIPHIMPGGLDFHSAYVVSLLAELPYFTPIRQANKDTQLTRNAVGLLLKPVSTSSTRETVSIESDIRQLQLV